MKLAARVALAIVVLLTGLFFLPRPASRVVAPDAFGKLPTGLPTDVIDLSPSPSPTKTKTPPPPPDDDEPKGGGGSKDPGTGGGGDGNGGNNGPGNGGGKTSTKGPGKGDKKSTTASGGPASGAAGKYKGRFIGTGEFTTDKLQLVAARLKAEGVSETKIQRLVYTPFIIGGPAAWTDTWGAPRYGPGPIVRTHEGQDVFCKYGDPVLATEKGTIEFDDGGLGGRVARLHRQDGSYWYYAHLSDWNTAEFKNGDTVKAGDVIGYCGNTGNAITTPPHVHFGWYQANGNSKNPMGALVTWLKTAEKNAARAFARITGDRLRDYKESQSQRLLGDTFAPEISILKVSSESLLAAASSPGAGAFGLAEAALQAALSDEAAASDVPSADELRELEGAEGDVHSELTHLLEGDASVAPPTGD